MLERGIYNPTLDVAARIAKALEACTRIRFRAELLLRARSQCQMCGRTVAQHSIVLVVVQKTPGGWMPFHNVENYWILCEDCS